MIETENLNDINEIGVDGEEVKTKDIDNEDVMHRDITENEPETNRNTSKKITEECPNDEDDETKEKIAENENEGVIRRDITKN